MVKFFKFKYIENNKIYTEDWFSHNLPIWNQIVLPHLQKINFPMVLEIGAFEGRASSWFLESHAKLKITVIDPWNYTAGASDSTYKRFLSNTKMHRKRVKVLKTCSKDALGSLPLDAYDVVYIDGEHSSASVLHDAVGAFNCCKLGGLIIFDDYLGGDLSINYPKPAIDFFEEAYGNKILRISDAYQRVYKKMENL